MKIRRVQGLTHMSSVNVDLTSTFCGLTLKETEISRMLLVSLSLFSPLIIRSTFIERRFLTEKDCVSICWFEWKCHCATDWRLESWISERRYVSRSFSWWDVDSRTNWQTIGTNFRFWFSSLNSNPSWLAVLNDKVHVQFLKLWVLDCV